RIVSKLREHLERRDLGVKHLVVFVDELNKYAPGDGADTYVRKMLLDIAERGRYLGLVLFSAQQFRSQVHRRVVGNSGTALCGRWIRPSRCRGCRIWSRYIPRKRSSARATRRSSRAPTRCGRTSKLNFANTFRPRRPLARWRQASSPRRKTIHMAFRKTELVL